jgi:hypothetical protein
MQIRSPTGTADQIPHWDRSSDPWDPLVYFFGENDEHRGGGSTGSRLKRDEGEDINRSNVLFGFGYNGETLMIDDGVACVDVSRWGMRREEWMFFR